VSLQSVPKWNRFNEDKTMKQDNFKKGEIIIYKSKEGPNLKVRLEDETVWLSQKQMALLFDKGVPTIN